MAISFQSLWDNHPSNLKPPDNEPCKNKNGEPAFANQCAIRMGVCLTKTNIDLSSCKAVRCWFHSKKNNHFLRAQELANWIKNNASTFGKVQVKKKSENISAYDYNGKTGIVFFKNFWGSGNQGDHIDVWNKSKQAHGSDQYFKDAEEVWFWDI